MAVVRDDSQQTTANIGIVDEGGNRRTVASVTCQIRPSRGMTISLDVLDEAATNAANRAEVASIVTTYMAEEIAKAAALGVPVDSLTATE